MAADREMKIEQVDLAGIEFTRELLSTVPAEVARRFEVLPFFYDPPRLGIVFGSVPIPLHKFEQLWELLGRRKELVVRAADPWVLSYYIHKLYGSSVDEKDSS